MTVVVARDQTTSGHIVFPWPDPLPWGSSLVCAEDEVAIICPNWQVGEKFGPGQHTISPPNPQSYILAYFFRTTAEPIAFEQIITVLDRSTNQPTRLHFSGVAQIKVGDPTLLCHQLVGLPYHDLATGILQSAKKSVCKVFQHIISKVCMKSPSAATLANQDAIARLVQMVMRANPMAIAVTGLELVNFDSFTMTLEDTGEPIAWNPGHTISSPAVPVPPPDSTGERPIPAEPGPVEHVKTQPLPAVDAEGQQSSPAIAVPPGAGSGPPPAAPSGPPAAVPPPVPAKPAPGAKTQQGMGVVQVKRPTPPTPMQAQTPSQPPAPSPMGQSTMGPGTPVLVYGNDGLWHMATIQEYNKGRYKIALDGTDTVTWVPATQVRPR